MRLAYLKSPEKRWGVWYGYIRDSSIKSTSSDLYARFFATLDVLVNFGISKIYDFNVKIVTDHNVAWFQISMSNVLWLQILKSKYNLSWEELDSALWKAHWLLVDQILKSSIWHVFHHDIQIFLVWKWMVKLRQERAYFVFTEKIFLPENTLNFIRLDQEFFRQSFDSKFLLIPAMLHSS